MQSTPPESTLGKRAITDTVTIEVVLALPHKQYSLNLAVTAETSARQAVSLALDAGLLPAGLSVDVDPLNAPLGVFGERVHDEYVCRSGDRVEIYRPLQQDPKELRRQRARSAG